MSRESTSNDPPTPTIDWTNFEEEQIHFYDYIQPHGVLLALEEPQLNILQVSNNTATIFGIPPEEMLQKPLRKFFAKSQIAKLKKIIAHNEFDSINSIKFRLKTAENYLFIDGIVHRNNDGLLLVELEPSTSNNELQFLNFYHLIKSSALKLRTTPKFSDMCQILVQEVRKITGFDRAMLYKFDRDWHGHVIAEDKQEELEPLLGLHYPSADTKPCRKLFGLNWVRLIPDINAQSVKIVPDRNPISKSPLDLTFSVLRGVSPCHREYLQNMGVTATLVISLTKERELWGLISCHHYSPRYIAYEVREACEFLGQVMSVELAVKEDNENYEYRVELKDVRAKLIEYMSAEDNFIDGLIKHRPNLLDIANASSAVVWWSGDCTVVGKAPETSEIKELIDWLENNIAENVFHTDSLSHLYSAAENYQGIASGLLSISISDGHYILWFRPEFIQTVNWAGNPHQTVLERVDDRGTARLSPRGSFEAWKEIVRRRSLPWKSCEIEAVRDLRNAIINIVLLQADEMAKLARELERSNAELEKFAFIASHDLQEPLNLVSSYVQLLEMRYQDRLDEDAKDFIGFAVEGVNHMQTLIDDLLAYSRVGRKGKEFAPTDVEMVLNRALTNLQSRILETGAEIAHDPLPTAIVDDTQLTQLFQNLLSNAMKFRSDRPLEIQIGVRQQNRMWLFSVRDNGIGIEPQFCDRIFLIFQQLHARDEYPGTGIGLAICKKIVERHGGSIWVESQFGRGSTFYFTIPAREELRSMTA